MIELMRARFSSSIAGGNSWMTPLIAMLAERRGRSCRRTRRMVRPLRFCTVREIARAVKTMVRCASIASLVRANRGLACRSVFDMRKDCSTCHSA